MPDLFGPMPHDEALREIERLPIAGLSNEDVVMAYLIMRQGVPPECQDEFADAVKASQRFTVIAD